MWGSAQADRSIIASGPPPRTPSPAFGLGEHLAVKTFTSPRQARNLRQEAGPREFQIHRIGEASAS
jgi:hypothetical protein